MLDIMAGMDQKDSFLRGFWWRFHRCSSWMRLSCPFSATTLAPVPAVHSGGAAGAAHHRVIYIPFVTQSLVPMVHTVQQTMRFHGCSSSTRINMPVVEPHTCLGWSRQCSFLWGSAVGIVLDVVFSGCVHRYTARGSPAIRTGKGWRGRRELAPWCSATQLGA